MRDEEDQDWDRLTGESSKAYHHFCLYRDMGPTRSLRQMANVPGCTSVRRQLNRWSSKWRWVERSHAYDDYLEYQHRLQQEKKRREMNERHAKIGILGQNVAVKGIENLLAKVQTGQQDLGPSELARLVDVSVKVERVARGESTDIHEAVGPGGGPVRLSIESVEQKAREAIEKSLGISDRSPVGRAETEREADLPPVPDPLGDGDEPAGAGG
jgi:hypothetical protein